MMDEMQELQEQSKEINDALAQSMGGMDGVEDDELAAEFARLEEEAAMEKMVDMSVPAVNTAAASGYAAPAAPAAAKTAEEEEYAALLASMGQTPAAALPQ